MRVQVVTGTGDDVLGKKIQESKNDEGRDGERDQFGGALKGTAREVEAAASAITRSPELRTES